MYICFYDVYSFVDVDVYIEYSEGIIENFIKVCNCGRGCDLGFFEIRLFRVFYSLVIFFGVVVIVVGGYWVDFEGWGKLNECVGVGIR